MAIYKTRTELKNFQLSNGKTVNLLDLIDDHAPVNWVAPTHAPEIGTVAYADAMGKMRRGVVVKTTKTKVHVAVTTQGAVDAAMRRWGWTQPVRVQIVIADTNYVRVAPPAEPVAETLDATSELAQSLVGADHAEALAEKAEREQLQITAETHAVGGSLARENTGSAEVEMGPIDKAAILAKPIDSLMNSGVREATGSAVVKLLERVHERIRQNHPEVPAMVIVTGAGTQAGSNKWGHFRPNGWTTSEKSAIHEMFMAGETLAKGAKQVLQTMLHESAHALAEVRGKQDTSRQNRWHNKVFLETAREVGLEHKSDKADKAHGYSFVTLTEDTTAEYQDLLDALNQEIHLMVKLPFWLGGDKDGDEGGGDGMGRAPRGEGGSSNGGNLKLTCLCEEPNIIRASRKVADLQVVNCGDCDALFSERG